MTCVTQRQGQTSLAGGCTPPSSSWSRNISLISTYLPDTRPQTLPRGSSCNRLDCPAFQSARRKAPVLDLSGSPRSGGSPRIISPMRGCTHYNSFLYGSCQVFCRHFGSRQNPPFVGRSGNVAYREGSTSVEYNRILNQVQPDLEIKIGLPVFVKLMGVDHPGNVVEFA